MADAGTGSPEKAFDREWATALLSKVVERLQASYQAEGRGAQFALLKGFLAGSGETFSYAEIAARLGMEPGTARVAVHRLRKRYRSILREEIAHTLSDSAGVEEELRALFGAFS